MASRPPLSYANAQPDLPGSDFAAKLAELRIARTFAERSKSQEQDNAPARDAARPSDPSDRSMIAKDRPQPVLRPSPAFAADVDAQSFNDRWEAERRRAAPKPPEATPTQGDDTMSDQTQDQNQSVQASRRPEETLREGPLKAAIWRNEGEHGAYHSVTLARTYKDRDGNLQDTSSFRAKDMLGLSELARRAHHEAHDRDRAAFKEHRQAQEQSQTRSQGHSR